ncbi:uncharacterized protein EV420DRAFT_1721990 [Desarmillaria tabescens]|uniref:Uncharacterized protein n=1 Tax=Armillaria tabescens TaxID=1929756 RepID=A0AA39JKW7_ARMTA|nr:uncharacterized protein EV420DRAFT_1721990 [Desarmillaria tabescens]KAK0444640.1 hypothetical protein EV420DRAFT_1721990 [Desarmillaria tabescens]
MADVVIKKTSKSSHIKTRQHIRALERTNGDSISDITASRTLPVPPSQPTLPRFASLRTLNEYLQDDLNMVIDADVSKDLFNDVHLDEAQGIYQDNFGRNILFSAGEREVHAMEQRRHRLYKQLDGLALLERHTLFGRFDDAESAAPDDLAEDNLSSTASQMIADLEALAIGDDNDDEDDGDDDVASWDQESKADADWYPHKSKTMFMLDLLDNLPRLRLLDDHLKAVIWVMRECGTPDVPSFSALCKTQTKLTHAFGLKPEHHISALGNHFYMNHPRKLLALDWANPLVRKHIHVYPEVAGPITETYQAAKWLEEVDLDELSPMWANWTSPGLRHRHFYIKELARLSDDSYVVILRWVTVNGIVHADVLETVTETGLSEGELPFLYVTIHTHKVSRIPAMSLTENILDIRVHAPGGVQFSAYSPIFPMPNPLREVARGCPMYRLCVTPWSDDVSGNVSKQYNAHTNIYVTNANLPHGKLSQEYFVRYCSTSANASSSEQFVALCEDFDRDQWEKAYDCEIHEDILFQIIPHVLPADNPQQSETSSHIGVNGNFSCRRDLTGGSSEQKESVDGYEALYHPGKDERTVTQTIQAIRWQIWLACQGNQEGVKNASASSGVKDKLSQYWIEQLIIKSRALQDERIKNAETCDSLVEEITYAIQQELWDWVIQQPEESYKKLSPNDRIDPHRDTPGEILHTYLLGNDKYVWHDTSKTWSKQNDDTFAIRLQSSCIHGLTIAQPRAAYLVQYKNSLIGKHFKTLQQLAIFHLHELCPPQIFTLWKATGELGALLWYPEIRDIDQYLIDLQVLIDNLLDAWAIVDPRRIITKVKLHVLTHLPDDIRRFGPAVIFATEIFECFNAVFRMCSILSNHLAPSRDIAITMADMERFKHMASGGWWKDESEQYIQAGHKIQIFLKKNVELQRRLGWADETLLQPGHVKLAPRLDVLNAPLDSRPFDCQTWDNGVLVVSNSRNLCRISSWVTETGRIIKILAKTGLPLTNNNVVIIIEHFQVADVKDGRLNMPLLINSQDLIAVGAQDILFDFNAQHDCVTGHCQIGESTSYVMQERIKTAARQRCIVHTNHSQFHLNMHALHNAHLIREALPRHLVAPVPLRDCRAQFHQELSAKLQVSGAAKRALTRAKAKDTRERNKKAKEAFTAEAER